MDIGAQNPPLPTTVSRALQGRIPDPRIPPSTSRARKQAVPPLTHPPPCLSPEAQHANARPIPANAAGADRKRHAPRSRNCGCPLFLPWAASVGPVPAGAVGAAIPGSTPISVPMKAAIAVAVQQALAAVGNSTIALLGSFDLNFDVVNVNCCAGTATIRYNAGNTSSWQSALRPLGISQAGPNSQLYQQIAAAVGPGFGTTASQNFYWESLIQFKTAPNCIVLNGMNPKKGDPTDELIISLINRSNKAHR